MTSLYLCYQSLLELLTQTQVVAYLEGLAQAGYSITLLTFEPRRPNRTEIQIWKRRLGQEDIEWKWLQYHKRPSVPATAWDIVVGIIVGLRLIARQKVQLVHARAHVPGVMAFVLKRLAGVKVIFDIRGFMAEEYVDGGVWKPKGLLFQLAKRVERVLVKAADGIVVLTYKAKQRLHECYAQEVKGKPVQVIPCCVDLRGKEILQQSTRNGETISFAYVGKLGGWYQAEEMVRFVAAVKRLASDLRWQVWTQSDPLPVKSLVQQYRLDGEVSFGTVPPDRLLVELTKANAAIVFYSRPLSGFACSPAKLGEYLAAGLPVVANSGIGDVDDLLKGSDGHAVGVVVRDFSEEAYEDAARELRKLLSDPDIRSRCRAVAEKHLDLVNIGWRRYRDLYAQLL